VPQAVPQDARDPGPKDRRAPVPGVTRASHHHQSPGVLTGNNGKGVLPVTFQPDRPGPVTPGTRDARDPGCPGRNLPRGSTFALACDCSRALACVVQPGVAAVRRRRAARAGERPRCQPGRSPVSTVWAGPGTGAAARTCRREEPPSPSACGPVQLWVRRPGAGEDPGRRSPGGRAGQGVLVGLPAGWVAGAWEGGEVGFPAGWVGRACEGRVVGLPAGWVAGAWGDGLPGCATPAQ
jgi:hypothetical protein